MPLLPVITLNKKLIIGTRKRKKNKAKKSKMAHPYTSKNTLISLNCDGKMEKSTFDPSNGGMGTRLKTPKTIFAYTITRKKSVNWVPGSILTKIPKIMASKKLEAGPANATIAVPFLILRKLKGFIGTGFANANKKVPLEIKYKTAGINRVPT